MNYYEYENYLAHYGVKGMKWGVRRYRKKDGTSTSAGKKHQASNTLSKGFIDDLKNGFETDEYGLYETSAMTKIGNSNVRVSVRSRKGSESSDINAALTFLKKFNDDDVRNSVAKEYYDDDYMRNEWLTDSSGKTMARNQFKERMRLVDISIHPDWGIYEAYYSDGGTYGGHWFVTEGDMRTGKTRHISLEG